MGSCASDCICSDFSVENESQKHIVIRMMKIYHAILATAFALAPAILNAGEVTLYTHRHYEADEKLFAEFAKESGIKVNVVKSGADQLMERLKQEGENSPADLLMTADAGRLHRAKASGLLQPATSEILTKQVPASLRDPDDQWFGFTSRARVIVYSKERVQPAELSTYENLTDKKWRGRILVRSSSNIYNQSLLASMIAAHGEKEALAWVRAVRGNMARAPQGSDRDQMRGVAAGLADIAIVNTYYVGLLKNSSDPKDREVAKKIGVFFPNQDGRGSHINVSGAGVVKTSKNKAEAVKLLEFLASPKAQASFPNATYEYPVVQGIAWSDLLKTWGDFKPDSLNLAKLGELNKAAVKLFGKAGWE